MSSYYFSIVGTRDNPLYEVEFSSFKTATTSSSTGSSVPGISQFPTNIKEILPFVTNSSLDLIEDFQWTTSSFNLGKIDSFYGLLVYGFITQGNIKFILCFEGSNNNNNGSSAQKYNENSIKQFFVDVNDLYVKCLLNPFYAVNDAITSPDFDLKVKLLAKKYL
ncbi:transport protein particle 20 kDa subunit [Scheffersomyces xylosifermentans]|uniref:transport protein particle 20 kDa subunit n=1 Tax=Scheffersomyces xylosifermentans TaxID=1304137 RepID=UPI00315CD874